MFSIRKTAKVKTRDYYPNILRASNELLNMRTKNNQKYLVSCIFGEHKPIKQGASNSNTDIGQGPVSDIMNRQKDQMKEQDINKLQRLMEENFISWMVITHDTDQLKAEKLYKVIFSAKRSLIININNENMQNDSLSSKIREFF